MSLSELLERPTERPWTPTDEGTVRFALVGVGWWTRERALPALADGVNTTPTTLVTSSPERVASLQEEYPTLEHAVTYEAFADGVAADAYDAVYVCTPNATHLEHVTAAAEHGKAVICEKPLEASVERAERLVEAVETAGTPLMAAYRMQTDPTIRRLRALIREGRLGDPMVVHANMSQHLLEVIDGGGWRLDPALAGRGATVTDLGVYPINTIRFLLERDPVSVTATGSSTHEAFSEVPDEHASFEMQLEDDTVATCATSQNAQLTGWLNVVGTEGAFELTPAFFPNDEQSLRLSLGEDVHHVSYTPGDQMREEFTFFADRVLTGEPMEADGRHALVDIRTVDAIYDAIESGERERVS